MKLQRMPMMGYYTYDEKHSAVQAIRNKVATRAEVAAKMHVAPSTVETWMREDSVGLYDKGRVDRYRSTHASISPSDRLEAARMVLVHGLAHEVAAAQYGVCFNTVRKWCALYRDEITKEREASASAKEKSNTTIIAEQRTRIAALEKEIAVKSARIAELEKSMTTARSEALREKEQSASLRNIIDAQRKTIEQHNSIDGQLQASLQSAVETFNRQVKNIVKEAGYRRLKGE